MPQHTDEQLQRIAAGLQDLICILTETQGWLQASGPHGKAVSHEQAQLSAHSPAHL